MTEKSTFLAWIFRMPLIKRWGLMHCVKQENVAEHSHQVAVIAHLLVVIKNTRYGGDLCPDRAATLAIFHECAETLTQDVASVVKYQNPALTEQFKNLEMMAEQQCLETLPDDLRASYANLIIQKEVDPKYRPIVKAADVISAYLKTLDELDFGNKEFKSVKPSLEVKLIALSKTMPEVTDVIEIFAEKCLSTLDELTTA